MQKSTSNLVYFLTKIRRRIFYSPNHLAYKKISPENKKADARNPKNGNEAELDAEM